MNLLSNEIISKIQVNRPFYIKQGIKEKIFSWSELENILNLRPFVSDKRFVFINHNKYQWTNPSWSTDNSFPASLLDEEIKKYVCYLVDCSKINEKVNAVCGQLESATEGSAVDAHIFFSLNYSNTDIWPFVHRDVSNNLIIQIEGRTVFKIWDAREDRNTLDQPEMEVVMEPGDVLYIPRDIWHGALSMTKRLSVSFPISTQRPCILEDRHWIKLDI